MHVHVSGLQNFQEHTSDKYFRATISVGNVRSRFLCSRRDFKFFKLAIDGGKVSKELSLNIKPRRLIKFPTVSGISHKLLPPKHRTLSLEIEI